MYAGVEFGADDYNKTPDSLKIAASCISSGGSVEVWLDSLEAGEKIAECFISNTGNLRTYQTFTAAVEPVSGRHDVYLKFTGAEEGELFQLQWFHFTAKADTLVSVPEKSRINIPTMYNLEQNFPNPFNPSTTIEFALAEDCDVHLTVYDILGRIVEDLAQGEYRAGHHRLIFDASDLTTGIYYYKLETDNYTKIKKLVLLK